MIPTQLQLRNFLSYGDDVEALDFTSFQIACLSGKNGHGKSALLDAMTWALWGQARKADYSRSPDPDLLRLSAEAMSVDFQFMLDGREYRVLREFTAKRRSGKIEFWGRNETNGDYRLLTGNSKRETQKRITETIGLDYNTFVCSSFLQQGKADAFTRQSPKERKEILCTILGLDYYERLLEETKLLWSATRAEIKVVEAQLETLNNALDDEKNVLQQEQQSRQDLEEKEKKIVSIIEQEQKIQQKLSELELIRDRVNRWQKEQQSINTQIEEYNKRLAKLNQDIATHQALIQRESEINQHNLRYEEIGKLLNGLLSVEEHYRQKDLERQALERRIAQKKSEIKETLAAKTSELKQQEKTLQDHQTIIQQQAQIEQNYSAYKKMEADLNQLDKLKPTYDSYKQDIEKYEKEIDAARQQLAETLAGLRPSVKRLEAHQKRLTQFESTVQQVNKLQNECQQLKQSVETILDQGQQTKHNCQQYAKEIEHAKNEIKTLNEKQQLLATSESADCPLCKQGLNHHSKDEILKHFQDEIKAQEETINRLEEQLKTAETTRKKLLADYNQQKARLADQEKELATAQKQLTELEGFQNEIKELEQAEKTFQLTQQQLTNQAFAEEPRAKLKAAQEKLKQLSYTPEAHHALQKQVHEKRLAETTYQRLQDALNQEKILKPNIETTRQSIKQLEDQLNSQTFAKDELTQLESVVQALKPLETKLNERKKLQTEQHQLRNAPVEWNRLQHAKEQLPLLEQDQRYMQEQQKKINLELSELNQQIQQATPQLEELKKIQQQKLTIEQQRKAIETERDAIQLQLGAIQERKERLAKQKDEKKSLAAKLKDFHKDERHYDILKTAFSRDGIPALIMEEALPELEHYANQLLHRLTHGVFSVAFESQRQKQSGGMSETLDIKISDEMGTRNYEMFSGGEAFRTDFALRIALSQLLCHRAGRQLQMLVVDEGFGTQDSEGLNNIVEAITEIQDEFEKILIVTHLEELKERFPVRIEVSKEPGLGSQFQIIHT